MVNRTKNGRKMYVPRPIVEEVEEYCRNHNAPKRDAWRNLEEHMAVGKEMERVAGWLGMRRKKR